MTQGLSLYEKGDFPTMQIIHRQMLAWRLSIALIYTLLKSTFIPYLLVLTIFQPVIKFRGPPSQNRLCLFFVNKILSFLRRCKVWKFKKMQKTPTKVNSCCYNLEKSGRKRGKSHILASGLATPAVIVVHRKIMREIELGAAKLGADRVSSSVWF